MLLKANKTITTKRPLKPLYKKWWVWLIVILMAAIVFVSLLAYQSRHRRQRTVIPSTSPTQGPASASTNSSPGTNNDKQTAPATGFNPSNSNSAAKTNSGSSTLMIPTGQFVSNHRPGGSSPTSEQSVCNTTVGATCYIQFIKGNVTKKLNPQTTDGNGISIWNWDVKDAGLTAGSWQVSAVASLNGATTTSTDQQALEIQP